VLLDRDALETIGERARADVAHRQRRAAAAAEFDRRRRRRRIQAQAPGRQREVAPDRRAVRDGGRDLRIAVAGRQNSAGCRDHRGAGGRCVQRIEARTDIRIGTAARGDGGAVVDAHLRAVECEAAVRIAYLPDHQRALRGCAAAGAHRDVVDRPGGAERIEVVDTEIVGVEADQRGRSDHGCEID
jgi:hypothetical protein